MNHSGPASDQKVAVEVAKDKNGIDHVVLRNPRGGSVKVRTSFSLFFFGRLVFSFLFFYVKSLWKIEKKMWILKLDALFWLIIHIFCTNLAWEKHLIHLLMQVSLHGGQVLSWRTERGEELLFTSSKVHFGFSLPFSWDLCYILVLLGKFFIFCQIMNFSFFGWLRRQFSSHHMLSEEEFLSVFHRYFDACISVMSYLLMHLTCGFVPICVSLETEDR